MKSPFSWWKNPILAYEWENQARTLRLFMSSVPEEIGQYERDIFDLAINRLRFFKASFKQIEAKLGDPALGLSMDKLIAQIAPMPTRDEGLSSGEKFRKETAEIVADSIGKIDLLLAEVQSADDFRDCGHFRNWIAKVAYEAAGITQTKNTLFMGRFSYFPYLVQVRKSDDLQTQKLAHAEHYGPPQFLTIALVPFNAVLEQLVPAAETLEASIKMWSDHRILQRSKLMDYKIAHLQHSLAWALNLFQVLVILFAFGLSAFFFLAQDPWNLRKENRLLQEQARILAADLETAKKSGSSLEMPKAKRPSKTSTP